MTRISQQVLILVSVMLQNARGTLLETCKTLNVLPGGLKLTNVPFIRFVADDIKISCRNTTKSTEKDLLETLILGIEDKRIWIEEKFWN